MSNLIDDPEIEDEERPRPRQPDLPGEEGSRREADDEDSTDTWKRGGEESNVPVERE